MSYSEEDQKDILRKVLQIAIRNATLGKVGFAPDILIDPAIQQAYKMLEKYQDQEDFDIWKNGRLDLYTNQLTRNMIIQNLYDYELSEENFEAVNALIEAEEMLGANANDDNLIDLFDYTPEELERLRILAKYLNGIDRDIVFKEFAQKYDIYEV